MISIVRSIIALLCIFSFGCVQSCISGRFKVETPFGKGVDMTLSCGKESVRTDSDGVANFACLDAGRFVVKGVPSDSSKYQDLYIFGTAQTAFNYTTFFGTRDQAKAVFRTLGIDFNVERGIAVVGLDVSSDGSNQPESLEPAVGAGSALHYSAPNQNEEPQPFVYIGALPQFGAEITAQSQSFVTYPNVPVGTSKVTATPTPTSPCLLSPGLPSPQQELDFQVYADSISVISYIC